MLNFQRTLSTQDTVMQNIIRYIVNPESTTGVSLQDTTPFLPGDQAQKLISSYNEAAKASVDIMNDLSQLGASLAPGTLVNQPNAPPAIHPPRHQEPRKYPPTTINPSYSGQSEPMKTEYQTPNPEGYTSAATSPESPAHLNGPLPQSVKDDTQSNLSGFSNYQFPQDQTFRRQSKHRRITSLHSRPFNPSSRRRYSSRIRNPATSKYANCQRP